ncbi:MAG: hypothetical protein M1331_01675 [Candidatus Marsarchaeota archaeon]|nr:hypothetical protein [Candidatus Marsarchaeota archaeon]MCL5106089.1 hypothetical protein [Candidatus Marsarchaeota archaeon]
MSKLPIIIIAVIIVIIIAVFVTTKNTPLSSFSSNTPKQTTTTSASAQTTTAAANVVVPAACPKVVNTAAYSHVTNGDNCTGFLLNIGNYSTYETYGNTCPATVNIGLYAVYYNNATDCFPTVNLDKGAEYFNSSNITQTGLSTISITGLNVKYNYIGPATNSSGYSCGFYNYSNYYSMALTLRGNQQFILPIDFSSQTCGYTIGSIKAITPGFKVISTNPSLPFDMPGHGSQLQIQINISVANNNYSGPLTLVINEA